MRPFTSTLPIAEALAIIHDVATPIDRVERVSIAEAHDRVLAMDIVATHDVPAFDRSAMDGYAVIAADTQNATNAAPVRLRLLDRLYAGDNASVTVTAGTCVEIATGAPLPPGADAVVIVEETRSTALSTAPAASAGSAGTPTASTSAAASATTIDVLSSVRTGQHLVRRASDMRQGDAVLAAGVMLNASRLGALAALGIGTVDVYAKPIVSILPTGNELVDPGRPLPPGHVYEVNRFTLAAIAQRHGCVTQIHPPALDTLDALRQALDDALRARSASHGSGEGKANDARQVDVLVLSGGSSVGERDLVLDVLRERGDVLFHGLAVKPGKPTGLARIGRTLVMAMPGNPTSCLSNAHILLIPLLRQIARLPAHRAQTQQLPLAARVTSPAGRHQFLPVRIDEGRAQPTFKGSGEITSLSRADGYIEIPADTEIVNEGEMVTVVMY